MSSIADMTFIIVLNDHTFDIHFAFAIIFKKNLHMNVAKAYFYFIVFSAMIVKKFNEKNMEYRLIPKTLETTSMYVNKSINNIERGDELLIFAELRIFHET